MHACPDCGEEMDLRGGNVLDDMSDFMLICWDCENGLGHRWHNS